MLLRPDGGLSGLSEVLQLLLAFNMFGSQAHCRRNFRTSPSTWPTLPGSRGTNRTLPWLSRVPELLSLLVGCRSYATSVLGVSPIGNPPITGLCWEQITVGGWVPSTGSSWLDM